MVTFTNGNLIEFIFLHSHRYKILMSCFWCRSLDSTAPIYSPLIRAPSLLLLTHISVIPSHKIINGLPPSPLSPKKHSAPPFKMSLKQSVVPLGLVPLSGTAGRALLCTASQQGWPLTCKELGQAGSWRAPKALPNS